MYVAEIRSVSIRVLDDSTCQLLKQEYERLVLISMLVLWTRYGEGKLGIIRFVPLPKNPDHSFEEHRFLTTGYSTRQRLIIVAHTDRDDRLRLISARDVTPAERNTYEQEPK